MICSQISIFEPLKTTNITAQEGMTMLWFALKLVSLNHWKQRQSKENRIPVVVICSQISIFEPLKTTMCCRAIILHRLWFALKLVSLNHWKQLRRLLHLVPRVVICSQISIFEPLKTTTSLYQRCAPSLWFALKLVSLNHWKQRRPTHRGCSNSCDLLSN